MTLAFSILICVGIAASNLAIGIWVGRMWERDEWIPLRIRK